MNDRTPVNNIRICGVHSIVFSNEQIDDVISLQRGQNLTSPELEAAIKTTKHALNSIRLIEIEVDPPNAAIQWSEIAQAVDSEPRDNWQVAYDEHEINRTNGHWAFFLHFFVEGSPIVTELGDILPPPTTPLPFHLSHIKYESPG